MDKTIVVTGVSGGIGEGLAREFAGAGARVLLGARRLDRIRRIAAEINAAGGIAEARALENPVIAAIFAAILFLIDLVEQIRRFGGAGIGLQQRAESAGDTAKAKKLDKEIESAQSMLEMIRRSAASL